MDYMRVKNIKTESSGAKVIYTATITAPKYWWYEFYENAPDMEIEAKDIDNINYRKIPTTDDYYLSGPFKDIKKSFVNNLIEAYRAKEDEQTLRLMEALIGGGRILTKTVTFSDIPWNSNMKTADPHLWKMFSRQLQEGAKNGSSN